MFQKGQTRDQRQKDSNRRKGDDADTMKLEQRNAHSHHGCLNLKGKSHECLRCEIMARGFCDELTDILRRMVSNLDNTYAGIPLEDRDEILSDTVIGV